MWCFFKVQGRVSLTFGQRGIPEDCWKSIIVEAEATFAHQHFVCDCYVLLSKPCKAAFVTVIQFCRTFFFFSSFCSKCQSVARYYLTRSDLIITQTAGVGVTCSGMAGSLFIFLLLCKAVQYMCACRSASKLAEASDTSCTSKKKTSRGVCCLLDWLTDRPGSQSSHDSLKWSFSASASRCGCRPHALFVTKH